MLYARMPPDPRAQALLDMLNRIDAPRLHEQPLDVARRNFQKLLYVYRDEVPEIGLVEDLTLARREHAGGPLAARLYRPREAVLSCPVLLWLHGGGWTLGDVAGYDGVCRALAHQADCAVLSLEYRLAPEHAFPAALDDVQFAWRWLQREAPALGLDVGRMAVAGDSAGGNLAAVLCHILRDAGQAMPRLQWLIYPSTDQLSERASHQHYAEGYFLDRASIAWFQRNYLPSEADRHDWRASPIRAARFDGLSPLLLTTAECDPLHDDGVAYLERLTLAGVRTRHDEYPGMVHGFLTMGRILPPANQAIATAAAALREAFALERTA